MAEKELPTGKVTSVLMAENSLYSSTSKGKEGAEETLWGGGSASAIQMWSLVVNLLDGETNRVSDAKQRHWEGLGKETAEHFLISLPCLRSWFSVAVVGD